MGILEQILEEQQKTNSFLEKLVAGKSVTVSDNSASDDVDTSAQDDSPKKTTRTRTTKKQDDAPSKPKHTKDEVVAAVISVKDAFGAPAAKAITAQFGYEKIAQAKEEHFDAIFNACQEKLAEQEEASEDDDDI